MNEILNVKPIMLNININIKNNPINVAINLTKYKIIFAKIFKNANGSLSLIMICGSFFSKLNFSFFSLAVSLDRDVLFSLLIVSFSRSLLIICS